MWSLSGPVDSTFGDAGLAAGFVDPKIPAGDVTRVAVAPDGAVLAYMGHSSEDSLFKWTSQGVLDTGFGAGGRFRLPDASDSPLVNSGAVALRPDGSVVLMHTVVRTLSGGKFPEHTFVTTLYQFTPQGAPAPAFGTGGSVISPFSGKNMALDAAGNILVAGSTTVTRLTPAGAADPSWKATLPPQLFRSGTYGNPVAVAVGPGGTVQLVLSQTAGNPPSASYPSFLAARWLGDSGPTTDLTTTHLTVAGVPAGGIRC